MSKVHLCDLAAIHSDPTIQSDERTSFDNPVHPLDEFPPLYAKTGWDVNQGSPIVFSSEREGFAKRAVAQRKALIDLWRSNDKERGADKLWVMWEDDSLTEPGKTDKTTATYGELADFAESVWTDGKGHFHTPQYIHNSCIRRGYAAIASAYACIKRGTIKNAEQFKIPHTVRQYEPGKAGELAMMDDRVLENVQHGRRGYNLADLLTLAYKYVKLESANESQIARKLNIPKGMAEKVHKMAQLAVLYPSLKILERCRMSPKLVKNSDGTFREVYVKGGAILFKSVRKSELHILLGGKGKKGTPPEPQELTTAAMGKSAGVNKASEEQVERYFKLVYDGRKNEAKVMDRKTIDTRLTTIDESANERNKMVADILRAVLADDIDTINSYVVDKTELEDSKSTKSK